MMEPGEAVCCFLFPGWEHFSIISDRFLFLAGIFCDSRVLSTVSSVLGWEQGPTKCLLIGIKDIVPLPVFFCFICRGQTLSVWSSMTCIDKEKFLNSLISMGQLFQNMSDLSFFFSCINNLLEF